MKNTRNKIIKCAKHLIFNEKHKKITVNMIVDAANVTRQTFYYHFVDIPDLFSCILKEESDVLLHKTLQIEHSSERLKFFLEYAIKTKDSLEKVINLNYGSEFQTIFTHTIYDFFKKSFEQNDTFKTFSKQKQELFLQYHASAIMHIIEISDTSADIDYLVYEIQNIMSKSLK